MTDSPPISRRLLRGLRCRGNSIVEMAIVMPVLIMMAFGVVDFGDYVYLKNTLQGAALAGARAAIPWSATNSNLTGNTGVITSMMTAAGISSSNYTVTISPSNVSGVSAGTPITVTVTATWSNVGTNMLSTSMGGFSGSKKIVGTAVMQKESN